MGNEYVHPTMIHSGRFGIAGRSMWVKRSFGSVPFGWREGVPVQLQYLGQAGGTYNSGYFEVLAAHDHASSVKGHLGVLDKTADEIGAYGSIMRCVLFGYINVLVYGTVAVDDWLVPPAESHNGYGAFITDNGTNYSGRLRAIAKQASSGTESLIRAYLMP